MKKLLLALLAGSGLAYVLRRRQDAAQWVSSGVGSAATTVRDAMPGGSGKVAEPDDATLAHKVETEIFRTDEVPKGQINVNAELGVVYLRGEVPAQSMIDDLVDRARNVDGVSRVESLLHLPGQDAPMHAGGEM